MQDTYTFHRFLFDWQFLSSLLPIFDFICYVNSEYIDIWSAAVSRRHSILFYHFSGLAELMHKCGAVSSVPLFPSLDTIFDTTFLIYMKNQIFINIPSTPH